MWGGEELLLPFSNSNFRNGEGILKYGEVQPDEAERRVSKLRQGLYRQSKQAKILSLQDLCVGTTFAAHDVISYIWYSHGPHYWGA